MVGLLCVVTVVVGGWLIGYALSMKREREMCKMNYFLYFARFCNTRFFFFFFEKVATTDVVALMFIKKIIVRKILYGTLAFP